MHIGIDLGSRFIKTAVETGGKVAQHIEDTVSFYKTRMIRTDAGTSVDLSYIGADLANAEILATGYGRNLLQFDNLNIISEIKAHFYGVKSLCKENNFTLVDIGGQDCKVIDVKDGYINDFTMNDKCAASTGRFIEQAAAILNIPVAEFETLTDNPVPLSDTCAVFCESEIIGQLARGAKDLSLAAGVNLSVAKRLAPAIKKYKPERLIMAGGAASPALIHFISELTGVMGKVLENQQLNGALGCIAYMKRI